MLRARLVIQNRDGVFDPEGKVIAAGLARLGHAEVRGVRVGKIIELNLETDDETEARARVAAMCDAFLVNPVTERYDLEFIGA